MPYPGRGHINPMMNLCKLMATKRADVLVTFIVTQEWLDSLCHEPKPDNIRFATVPNVIPSEKARALWKTGWRVKGEEGVERLVTREEIAKLVWRIMDLENVEGKEMRRRAKNIKEICRRAVAEGGVISNRH
ncbi:hypothetical protein RJ639_003870 [Escallonia herrerae]|uniref:Uncharacterized protein n=1 Tax=Escallonia herrerae TaxID=1293975 RepID=A0AA88W4Q6_9ASTE|nr:hypothetical protein RJ639_003870 [Escallonia herrerae]